MGCVAAWVWVGGASRRGGMARWRSTWWVSRSVRSTMVGFSVVVVGEIDSFFVIIWWLFLVDVVVVGGF